MKHIVLLCVLLGTVAGNIPHTSFFPYGPENGDHILTPGDDNAENIVFNHNFPFFGTTHSYFWLGTNGVLGDNKILIKQHIPSGFPINTSGIIAPFWTDVDTNRSEGRVYYRQTTDTRLLTRASNDVKYHLPVHTYFFATWMFIVTWNNVTCYNCPTYPENTFQCVLVSDGTESFVFFYYDKINWVHGNAALAPAQVGFDSGDGIHFYKHPDSLTTQIASVVHGSNIGYPGKWIFPLFDPNGTASPTEKASQHMGVVTSGKTTTITFPSFIPSSTATSLEVDNSEIGTNVTSTSRLAQSSTNKPMFNTTTVQRVSTTASPAGKGFTCSVVCSMKCK